MEEKQPVPLCESCGGPMTQNQRVEYRCGRKVAHQKCAQIEAEKVDLAIDDWKLNRKF